MPHLNEEQKKFYEENGFIKLTDIFSEDEINEMCDDYDRLFQLKNNPEMEAAWKGEEMKKQTNSKEHTVKSVHNLQYHSSVFSRAIHNNRLLDAMEDIIKSKNIILHHTKAHLKSPKKGAPFVMHQDYHYFPYKNDSMVAAFIHLDDTTQENGGLCVYPGSHKLGPQQDKGEEVDGREFHYVDQTLFPIEKASPISAKRGDVIIFSYLLVHGSYSNLSDRPRRMFLMQLNSAEDQPLREAHKSPGQGWVLRGTNMAYEASRAIGE